MFQLTRNLKTYDCAVRRIQLDFAADGSLASAVVVGVAEHAMGEVEKAAALTTADLVAALTAAGAAPAKVRTGLLAAGQAALINAYADKEPQA